MNMAGSVRKNTPWTVTEVETRLCVALSVNDRVSCILALATLKRYFLDGNMNVPGSKPVLCQVVASRAGTVSGKGACGMSYCVFMSSHYIKRLTVSA